MGCSNQHFGVPSNLLRAGKGVDMGDGWETARHPSRPYVISTDPITGLVDTKLFDWAVLRMGCVVTDVERLVLETTHFKGNFPESVTIEYCNQPRMSPAEVCLKPGQDSRVQWKTLLPRTRMGPDAVFEFSASDLGDGKAIGDVTHLRLGIFPDGGVSRVRLFGRAKAPIFDENDQSIGRSSL